MAENRIDSYERILENGERITYEIRGLADDEIEDWAAFCASIFSYKANPPPASYFERHYRNDPTRVASLIRVAFCQGTMVASCRLFLRTVSLSGWSSLSAGGIGEVCTHNNHRRRGLSKVLLQNVIEIMKERNLQVSLLHAAPAFFPVYEKTGGYVCTTSQWSVIPITNSKLSLTAEQLSATTTIREATFPIDTDRLCNLHQSYSEQRLAGCIVRSKEYWNDYLSMELKGSLWVLEDAGGSVVAWLSIRHRGDRYQLREFGIDKNSSAISTGTALTLLLAHAMKTEAPIMDEWLLTLPTFVVDECQQENSLPFMDWSQVTRDDDLGWMYKILDEKISITSINSSTAPHLIWPADSF